MIQWIITPRPGQNQYYAENLAEGVLPLKMMLIPSGTFQMGSPDDEIDPTVKALSIK